MSKSASERTCSGQYVFPKLPKCAIRASSAPAAPQEAGALVSMGNLRRAGDVGVRGVRREDVEESPRARYLNLAAILWKLYLVIWLGFSKVSF